MARGRGAAGPRGRPAGRGRDRQSQGDDPVPDHGPGPRAAWSGRGPPACRRSDGGIRARPVRLGRGRSPGAGGSARAAHAAATATGPGRPGHSSPRRSAHDRANDDRGLADDPAHHRLPRSGRNRAAGMARPGARGSRKRAYDDHPAAAADCRRRPAPPRIRERVDRPRARGDHATCRLQHRYRDRDARWPDRARRPRRGRQERAGARTPGGRAHARRPRAPPTPGASDRRHLHAEQLRQPRRLVGHPDNQARRGGDPRRRPRPGASGGARRCPAITACWTVTRWGRSSPTWWR